MYHYDNIVSYFMKIMLLIQMWCKSTNRTLVCTKSGTNKRTLGP